MAYGMDWVDKDLDWVDKNLDWVDKNLDWVNKNLDWVDKDLDWVDIDLDWVNKDQFLLHNKRRLGAIYAGGAHFKGVTAHQMVSGGL